jgi:hypothetical protein
MQDKKDFNSTNWSKGKTQELIQKKSHRGMDVFVVFVERMVAWNVKSDMKDERI